MGATMNEDRYGVVQKTLTAAEVAINTTAEQDFTVEGLRVNDYVAVNKPTAQAGLGIAGVRVKAANTLSITYVNASAGAITPTAEAYTIFWFRAEKIGTRANA